MNVLAVDVGGTHVKVLEATAAKTAQTPATQPAAGQPDAKLESNAA